MAGWQLRVASNAAASSWDDITGYVERTTARFTGQAFDGQIGQGGVDLDDPEGDLVVPGYRVWELNKDGLVLERGRIGIRDYERGVVRTADAHERDITLIDCNADLSRIGVHRWARPAETDVTRVLALLDDYLNGSPRASTVIGDAWVRVANSRLMPAKRYDNANPHDVLQDCADVAAKIFFVTVDDAGAMDLFYDISTYTGYAAGFAITDDDPNLTTEFPPINPTASHNPEELFSKVRLTYGDGSTVTATDSAVAAAHDYLETIYHDDNATAGTAQNRADRFLDIHDEEEVMRRCAVSVPEGQLDEIRRGMTISYRAAATNDLTPITRRIAQLTWQPPIADGQDWIAILELDWPLKMGQRYTRPKPPAAGIAPYIPPNNDPDDLLGVAHVLIGVDNRSDADLQAESRTIMRTTGTPALVDQVSTSVTSVGARVEDESQPSLSVDYEAETRTFLQCVFGGVGTPTHARLRTRVYAVHQGGIDGLSALPLGPGATPLPESPMAWRICMGTWGGGTPVFTDIGGAIATGLLRVHEFGDPLTYYQDIDVYIPVSGSTLQLVMAVGDTEWLLNSKAGHTAGAVPMQYEPVPRHPDFPGFAHFHRDAIQNVLMTKPGSTVAETTISYVLEWYSGAIPVAPVVGQQVNSEASVIAADGSQTVFHTEFPYWPNSITVRINGIKVNDSVTAFDPATGEVTFAQPPAFGAEITFDYIAAGSSGG